MTPEEIKRQALLMEQVISDATEAVMAMQVSLDPEPQTVPGAYFQDTFAEIHTHESHLSDLIVKANQCRALADRWVREKKHDIEITYSDALVNNPEITRRKSAADRKAAALVVVAGEAQSLLLLQRVQGDCVQLCRSLARKAGELKSKSQDLRQQQKVWETEWQMTNKYRTGMGARSKDAFAPPRVGHQSPTAEDLGLKEEIAASKIKQQKLDLVKENVEENPAAGVSDREVDVFDGVEILSTPVVQQELSNAFVSPTASEEDLDLLLEESLGKSSSVGVVAEPEDLDSILSGRGGISEEDVVEALVKSGSPTG